MKKVSAIFICFLLTSCVGSTKRLGPESYRDLGSDVSECKNKFFPTVSGNNCAADEFDHLR
jgi:hypothetical protein